MIDRQERRTFAACGKEILRDDAHFADAASHEIASAIVTLLNCSAVICQDACEIEQAQMQKVLWA